jgi:hypothetical protein
MAIVHVLLVALIAATTSHAPRGVHGAAAKTTWPGDLAA